VADAIEYGISQGLPRQWAYRVARCESGYWPGAYNRSSGASGLYQFIPSTWRNTPQGRAGLSPFDPYANAEAAAWLFRVGGPGHWSCK
jgi:soluble lytic murein transglycosylase-like protein